jgi:hypothetical protein
MDELGIIVVRLVESSTLEQHYAILELGFDVQVLLLHGSDCVCFLLGSPFTWWLLTHHREVGVQQRVVFQLGLEVDGLGPQQALIGLPLFLSGHLYITT